MQNSATTQAKRHPFKIPPINNQKAALAQYLKLDCDDQAIQGRFTSGSIHHYVVDGQSYYVAHACHRLAGTALVEFNSSYWGVLQEDPEAPYIRFVDEKVQELLQAVAQPGLTVLAVNQKEGLMLCKTDNGLHQVWAYSSHDPADISSYYIKGNKCVSAGGINALFPQFNSPA